MPGCTIAVFKAIILTFEPQPAGPTFTRCALRGAHAGPKRTYGDIHIYKYINIYTRNLKFAQLVTALASLAQLFSLLQRSYRNSGN